MYFKFNCSECGKTLKVSEDKAGRKARCPYCHHTVTVPQPQVETPEGEDRAQIMSELMGELAPDQPAARSEPRDLPGAEAATPTAHAKKKVKERKPRASDAGGEQFAQGTEVSLWWSFLFGLIGTVWFYGLLWLTTLIKPNYFAALFMDRGWVPYAETLLMGWSMAILLAKRHKLRRQKESMLFDVLPNDLGAEITEDNVDKFVDHVRDLPTSPGESFLINRVLRGLNHFKVRGSNAEVASLLSSQSDIDATAVNSSYTLVKINVWAIPILGFIGTVIGMSDAVGSFSGAMEAASDVSKLKESLNQVTSGLGVAFDTTLVALVMSLLISFPQASMQKAEEDLLNWVDEYCNENLLKRLRDGGQGQQLDHSNAGVAKQMAAVQKELARLQASHVESLKGATALIETHTRKVDEFLAGLGGRAEQATVGLIEQAGKTQQRAAEHMEQSAERMRECFQGLQKGVESLNRVLSQLGQETVVVQLQAPPRRGLFGLGRAKNGG